MNSDRIIQVIPCVKPMIAVFGNSKDREYCFNWIYYMGLTMGGLVEPLVNLEGWIEKCNFYNNYIGVWDGVESTSEEAFYEEMKEWKENQSEY